MTTRIKILKVLCVVLSMVIAFPITAFAAPADDIRGHWAEAHISKWVGKGYIKGYSDGSFKPENEITRAELMAVINRAFGFAAAAGNISYKDLKSTDWFYGDVLKAVKAGYIRGHDDNTIKPNGKITNQEVAVIISRLLNLSSSSGFDLASKFRDAASIPSWSKGAIAAVAEKGYMKGYGDGTFRADKPITRAEAIAALDSCYLNHVKKNYSIPGKYTDGTVEGSLIVSAKDVTLENTVVNGNLILAESIGDGNAYLKNVTVKGDTVINGGGMNSIYVENSYINGIVVSKADNKVRIVASGTTSVGNTNLQSGARLEEQNLQGAGFGSVLISQAVPENAAVTLSGSFDSVELLADRASLSFAAGSIGNVNVAQQAAASAINIASGATVGNMLLNAAVSVTGNGKIQSAQVNAAGTTMEIKPANVTSPQGITVTINTPPASTPTSPSSGGGGGGGGGDTGSNSTKVQISAISDRNIEIGSSIQLEVVCNPSSAMITAVSENTGIAKVEAAGTTLNVTAVSEGTCKITITGSESGYVNGTASFYVIVVPKNSGDITPPAFSIVKALSCFSVQLIFDEELDKASAEAAEHYSIDNGIGSPSSAVMGEDKKSVVLTLLYPLSKNKIYKVSVYDVEDEMGNKCSISRRFFSNYDVPAGLIPPKVTTVEIINDTGLRVRFNEEVERASAETISNYFIDKGSINPTSAILGPDNTYVILTIPKLVQGITYYITISGIRDIDGNTVIPATKGFDSTMPVLEDAIGCFNDELRLTFNEPVEAGGTARVVVSYGEVKKYADLKVVGETAIDEEHVLVFEANKLMAPGESPDQGGDFSGPDFLMENMQYTIESVSYITDKVHNMFICNPGAKISFTGNPETNDKPEVIAYELVDGNTIRVVFSEPMLSSGGTVISKDGSATVFNISERDPDFYYNNDGYSTMDLTAGTPLTREAYSFDFSAVPGLTDFCGTHVKDTKDTEEDMGGYTDLAAGYVDTEVPYIEYVEAIENNIVYVYFNEPLSQPGSYKISYLDEGDVERTVSSIASINPDDNTVVKLTIPMKLSASIMYTLQSIVPAKDLAYNAAELDVPLEFAGTDVDNDYIKGVAIIDGKHITVRTTSPIDTARGDTIIVYDSADATKTDMIESISGMGTTELAISLNGCLCEDKSYTVETTGEVDGTYIFHGIIDDGGLAVDNGIITFSGCEEVQSYVVYVVYEGVPNLVIPASPASDFDASAILDSIGTESDYTIEVYAADTPQANDGVSWASPYAEYSEADNPDGFIKGLLLYYAKFTNFKI